MATVIITPEPHFQFLDMAGNPLAGGFIFTYDAGTTTLRNTFTDSSGLVQNQNPIPLDATGSPSNGSVQTGIWLGNQSYKFVAYNASMVQQWSSDNISGFFGLLNMANTWLLPQTFSSTITDTLVDNQFITGAAGNQTTLDYPPPTGNVTLHFPNTADTMVGRATTDTLTNKTLTSPTISNPTITGVASGVDTPIYRNVVTAVHTGTTSEDTMFTIPIPALTATAILRITFTWIPTVQGAAGTHVRARFAGTVLADMNFDNTGGYATHAIHSLFTIANRNATNSQVSDNINLFLQTIVSNQIVNLPGVLVAVNTSVPTSLTITAQSGANTDSQSFYYVLAELL